MDKKKLKDLLEVFLTLQVTKELPRQGFINFGFKRAESDSVAAHSFTVTAMTYFLAQSYTEQGYEIDVDHAIRIALIHDMGEAISGDIGYHVKRFAGELLDQVEEKTFAMLVGKLDFRQDILKLYQEYKALETTEAKITKCADALDAYAQMLLTPGADLGSQATFVKEKAEELSSDDILGDKLARDFLSATRILKKRQVTFIGG